MGNRCGLRSVRESRRKLKVGKDERPASSNPSAPSLQQLVGVLMFPALRVTAYDQGCFEFGDGWDGYSNNSRIGGWSVELISPKQQADVVEKLVSESAGNCPTVFTRSKKQSEQTLSRP